MDIGGNRELEAVSHTLCFLLRALRPTLVVVKSQALYTHAAKHTTNSGGSVDACCVPSVAEWWQALGDAVALEDLSPTHAENIAGACAHKRAGEHGSLRFTRHPLKYPPRQTAEGALICRYHNYSECLRNGPKARLTCLHDHDHCNHCGQLGHIARQCMEEF